MHIFIEAGQYMIFKSLARVILVKQVTISHFNANPLESPIFMLNGKPMLYILSRPFFKKNPKKKIQTCISNAQV